MYQPGFEPATPWLLSEYAIHYTTAAVKETVSSVPELFRADSGTNLIKQRENQIGRSVAQW